MSSCPYSDLFIYYCRGNLTHGPAMGQSGFLGAWEEEGDCFLFFAQPADHIVQCLLKKNPAIELVDTYQMPYEQWQGRPVAIIDVGPFLIAPPWHTFEQPLEKPCLWLDPGVVFGNGQHPTTLHCLEAMKLAFARRRPGRVVDLGTGTGVLALVAAMLGAEKVLAVDLNLLATVVARGNVCRNSLQDRVLVVQGRADKFMDLPFELVVSNIHYDVMALMIEAESFRKPKQFVFSGLFRSQAHTIENRLRQSGARIVETWQKDGIWHTFLAESV